MSSGVSLRARPVRGAWRNVLRLKLALVDKRRYNSIQLEHVCDLPFVVLPDVFNPALLRSGEFLASHVRTIPSGTRVLELGCGAGAAAVIAASRGCNATAVDINPSAVRCTRINALLNEVELDIRHGDLFAPIHNERFDVVLFNPPYYRGQPADGLDHAWRSPDVIERFARDLPDHLTPDGHALVVLSSDGASSDFLNAWSANGLRTDVAATRDLVNETFTIYRVSPGAC
jgi:release factor glutamine methyltransferase